MREAAGEGDAEHECQADEHGQAKHGHHRHRPAARQPPLKTGHDRVKDQRDEPGHDNEQLDFAQPVDHLAQQIGRRDHRHRRQDRPERNSPGLGGDPQSRHSAGPRVIVHPAIMSGHTALLLPIHRERPRSHQSYVPAQRTAGDVLPVRTE